MTRAELRKALAGVKPGDKLTLFFRYDAVEQFEALLRGAGCKPWALEDGAIERYRKLAAGGRWPEEATRKIRIRILPGFTPQAFEQDYFCTLQAPPVVEKKT